MAANLTLSDFNTLAWAKGDYVRAYSGRDLQPAEAVLLARHRQALGGTVLELGAGAGRITRLLVALATMVIALDVSERMVAACARNVPQAQARVGDLRDLSGFDAGTFGAVVASNNLIDVLADGDREAALEGFGRVLAPGGTLLFSSHNRGYAFPRRRGPRDVARAIRDFPQALRNRSEARPYVTETDGYAIVNDAAHAHRLAHYYISRDEQERQLSAAGFTLLEALDADGQPVGPGEASAGSPSLHYAAQRL